MFFLFVSLSLRCLLNSSIFFLAQWIFKNKLFSLHILVSMHLWIFPFSYCYWFLVSFNWSQKRYLRWFQSWLVKIALRPKMWSILGNVVCAVKNVYSFVVGLKVLNKPIRLRLVYSVLPGSCSLIFCLDVLSATKNYCAVVTFLLHMCKYLLDIFKFSDVGYIYNC